MTAATEIVFKSAEGGRLVGTRMGPETGPLVMLLHGGGQTRHAWARAAIRLAEEGYHVVRYDARGHGDSDWSATTDYSMTAHGADLLAVLRALGRPAALVGASMGGIASLLAAAEAPECARALVLVDIVPGFAAKGVERVRAFMRANPEGFASLDEAAAAVRAYNPARAAKNPEGLMRNLRKGDNGRLRWHWDPQVIGKKPDPGLTEMLSAKLASLPITLPLLLVAGADSDVVDAEALERFRAQAPHAETIAIARAGHMVAGDRNDAFGDTIVAFLKRTVKS